MASLLKSRCGYQCFQCQLHNLVYKARTSYSQSRALSTSNKSQSSRRSGGGPTRTSKLDKSQEQKRLEAKRSPPRIPSLFNFPKFPESLDHDARLEYESLGPEERAKADEKFNQFEEQMKDPAIAEILREGNETYPTPFENSYPENVEFPRPAPGLINMGESALQDDGEDDDELAEGDDITTLGHLELEAHRDFRKYARVIAWEMPLLFSKFALFPYTYKGLIGLTDLAKPFVPPSEDESLRFRYTTYMGEDHPAEKKVVVQFGVADLKNLTKQQLEKLIKLAGSRFNPQTGVIKMGCESFDTQAQNTRYLGDLVNKLIVEAQDPVDKMTDIPFDFRHHKPRPHFEFPESWKLTPTRVLELQAQRSPPGQISEELGEGLEQSESEIRQTIEQLTMDPGLTQQMVEEEILVPR
ncbi:MAG: 37S ribosomal protein S24, mitochondrial [Vezdaea aestivalis]|nr:MAG: 37S ribosomal protein S24, mitochondrial [Vezdaea aestivalis]